MNTSSISESFSSHLKQAFAKAYDFALEFGHPEITSMHLLYGLASQKGSLSSELLVKTEFPTDLLKQELIRAHHQPFVPQAPRVPALSEEVITLLTKSARTAQLHEHTYIGTEHVLACLLNLANQELLELFRVWQININELQQQLLLVLKSTSKFPDLTETLRQLQAHQDDFDQEAPEFPVLQSLATELTSPEQIALTAPLIGREDELQRMQQLLLRKYKNNPLLVGIAGVGKTALVEGLAQKIVSGDVPPVLLGKRIFHLELSSLVAGTMYRGEFEQRLKQLIEECQSNDDIILFIDEIHTLIGAGSTGQTLDAANTLKPALARGQLRCIGATTWNEYYKYFHQDSALARRFQMVPVQEPSEEETKQILLGTKTFLQDHHHVSITDKAIDQAIFLSKEHLPRLAWPDKALDLLDEASAQKKLLERIPKEQAKRVKLKKELELLQAKKQEALNEDLYEEALTYHEDIESVIKELKELAPKKKRRPKVSETDIADALLAKTGMSKQQIQFYPNEPIIAVYDQLQEEIIGQSQVLQTLSDFVERAFSPLKDPVKPLGSFLFLGPSGIGKTSTAKALAKALYGNEKSVHRIDMSEYAEKFSLSKLLGAPAGYIGYQETGLLTRLLREKPRAVVLFDEIEKAHPEIFHILLQLLDEGTVVDSAGNTIDFRQTVIIMTSNLGTNQLKKRLGFTESANLTKEIVQQELKGATKNFLSQELLNRLDEILIFEPLGIQARQAIIKKKLTELNSRLQNQFSVAIHDDVLTSIAENHYKDEEGARSLEQFLKQEVEIPLRKALAKKTKAKRIALIEKDGVFELELT